MPDLPPHDSTPPRDLSHYRVAEPLGSGAMGAVYRGVDRRDGSVVAVKLLHPHLTDDKSYRERFEREAHVGALLRSPYTVHLLDYGAERGQYFIVMEYVEGQTLKAAMQSGPLPWQRALRIAVQVARALDEAEARSVIHRDIKPDNLLLREDDSVKVADFGIARQLGAGTLTATGAFVGTLAYAAPEQFLGRADHRSDIYSLGATLYHMLAGRPPFAGSLQEMMAAASDKPVDLTPLSALPQSVTDIVKRCLEKDPHRRYQSAAHLAGVLEDAAQPERAAPEHVPTAVSPGREAEQTAPAQNSPVPPAAPAMPSGVPVKPPAEQEVRFCTTSDGVCIAYAVTGRGPTLVRSVGWFTHLEHEWETPYWRHLNEGFARRRTLVRYDGRGMGLSDRDVDDFSLDAKVRDLEAVINAAGAERCALFAASEGGPTGVAYAVRHPERVSRIVLYDTFAKLSSIQSEQLDLVLNLIRQGWGIDQPAYRQFFTSMFMPDATGDAIRLFTEFQRASAPAENAVKLATALFTIDIQDQATQLSVPTLVIHRRGDSAVPFQAGRELAALIPGARFLPLEGRNHIPQPEEPETAQLLAAIDDFLAEGE